MTGHRLEPCTKSIPYTLSVKTEGVIEVGIQRCTASGTRDDIDESRWPSLVSAHKGRARRVCHVLGSATPGTHCDSDVQSTRLTDGNARR